MNSDGVCKWFIASVFVFSVAVSCHTVDKVRPKDSSQGRVGDSEVKGVSDCPGPMPTFPEVPWMPYPRKVNHSWMTIEQWCRDHHASLRLPNRSQVPVVFIGESITSNWTYYGIEIWKKYFAQIAVNLGVGGDITQNVLWRIQNGALEGLKPKVVVILIGINNLGWSGNTPEDTAKGIGAVVKAVAEKVPSATIMHFAIFPSGSNRLDPFRQKINATNELLAKAAKHDRVVFVDIGKKFLNDETEQRLKSELFAEDQLHPSAKGYELWAQEIAPYLTKYAK